MMSLGVENPSSGGSENKENAQDSAQNVRLYMSAIVSLLILCSSLYIVLSNKFNDDSKKWAFGTIGTLIGFWLKP
jgi:hypothetical protein